jgi:beta-lactam-binding protein with PASTA domain
MSFKKFILSRTFLFNIILAIAIIIILIFITLLGIKNYTNHGSAYPVPDLRGLTEKEAQQQIKTEHLRYQIIDSVYLKNTDPGSVVDQFPKPGFKVKHNRTILLTINASAPEQVILPKLRDISYRQAQVLLDNCGLQLGNITFKPSEYSNLVLNVLSDSIEIYKGEVLPKESTIDLVIGKGYGLEKTSVPDLIGLTIDEARLIATDALLNPGVLIFDESILTNEDSINARLWKQRPDPRITSLIELGSSVDMWVTIDELKLNEAIEN